MRNYGALLRLLALAAAGVIYLPTLPREPARKAEPAAGDGCKGGPIVGGNAPAAATGDLRTRIDVAQATECAISPPAAEEQDYLIVTLPDPLASSSGYRFDSIVDTLQRAVETQHYVLDSYYYPWKPGAKLPQREVPRDRLRTSVSLEIGSWKEDAHLTVSAQREQQQSDGLPLYQGKPGFLVFRPTDASSFSKRRVILLVGETATRGIDKCAFHSSLHWMKKYNGYSYGKPIRVLGPYFSGSQTSLAEAINEWKNQPGEQLKFHIISGSATKISGKKFGSKFRKDICVRFQTTVHAEIVLKMELMKYLNITEDGSERVAILEESNTVFGQPPPLPEKKQGAHHVHLPFPLHISQVRNAYSRAQPDSGAPLPQLFSFSGRLHLPSTEGADPIDTEPCLTPISTAAIIEQVMSQILTTISREGCKYVVILATNLKDKVFLVKQIRTYCPDVQLLLSGSDLLFSHPDCRYCFKGALVVSTYPLYSKNQTWSYPFRGCQQRLLLPSDDCQGIYNAAIALLACNPNDLNHLLEYGPPFERVSVRYHRPPVWVSIIGQNGPHPLHGAMPATPQHKDCNLEELEEWEACESHVYVAEVESSDSPTFEPLATGYWIWSCFGMIFFCALLAIWTRECYCNAVEPAGKGEPFCYSMLCGVALAGVVLAIGRLLWWSYKSDADTLLFVERARDIAGGVTPILPIVFLSMAIFCLAYYQLDRRRLRATARLEKPFPDAGSEPLKEINKKDKELDDFLKLPLKEIFCQHSKTTYPALLILCFIFINVFGLFGIYGSYIPSVEAGFVNGALWLAFLVFTLFLAYVFQQLRLLWDKLHDLLRAIAQLPLANAFDRLPRTVTDGLGPYLSSESPGRHSQEELPCQQWRALASCYPSVRGRLQKIANGANLDQALSVSGREATQADFTSAAKACLEVLGKYWKFITVREGHADPTTVDAGGRTNKEAVDLYLTRSCMLAGISEEDRKALQAWLQMAEDLAAIEITAYLSQFFVHLRKLARSLTWGSLLAILAIVSYPFHPQRLMLMTAGALVIFVVVYITYILVCVEWDEVVSRIRKTTPKRLNFSWDFVHSIALCIVPLLGVLAAASPDLSNVLHSLLDPIYQVLK